MNPAVMLPLLIVAISLEGLALRDRADQQGISSYPDAVLGTQIQVRSASVTIHIPISKRASPTISRVMFTK